MASKEGAEKALQALRKLNGLYLKAQEVEDALSHMNGYSGWEADDMRQAISLIGKSVAMAVMKSVASHGERDLLAWLAKGMHTD